MSSTVRHKTHHAAKPVVFVLAMFIAVTALPQTGFTQNHSLATQQLFVAADKGDLASIKDSLAKGADLSARNRADKTAIDVAVTKGHFDIVQFLLGERNKLIKKRLGLNQPASPTAPPSREAQPTRLEPVRAVENAAPSPEPAPAPAVKTETLQKAQPDLSEIQLETPAKETDKQVKAETKPQPTAAPAPQQTATVAAAAPDPDTSEKRSSFRRLLDRFLYRFGLGDDRPEPWKKDNRLIISKPTAPKTAPKTTPSPEPETTPAKLEATTVKETPNDAEPVAKKPVLQTAQPSPEKPVAPAEPKQQAEQPLDEETMSIEEGPRKTDPGPPTPLPTAKTEPVPAPAPAAKAQPSPAPALTPPAQEPVRSTDNIIKPDTEENTSAVKKHVDKFMSRINESVAALMGKKETQTASKQPTPAKADKAKESEKPTETSAFLDKFKETVDKVQEKIIPGSKTPASDPSKPSKPIIIARPGEKPPLPPGQLIDDKPPEFTPEVQTRITKSSPANTEAQQPAPPDSLLATQKKQLTEAEKVIASLAKKQADAKAAAARRAKRMVPKRDKILTNKEIEDAIVQLGGRLEDLPKLEKPAPVAETDAPAKDKAPLSAQRQAEVDVMALLQNEASKVSGKQPDQGAKKSKSKDDIEDTLSKLAEGIGVPTDSKSEKKKEKPKKKPPADDLEAALANIDSLTLTEPSKKDDGKSASATALPGLEPGPDLPGLEPGPLPKDGGAQKGRTAAIPTPPKSPLDKLPPIKGPSKADRPPTKIGGRLEKEADRVAKKDPGFLERMTNVLQLEDTPKKPADQATKKDKANIPSSPESPSQWAATVTKTTRLDEARKTHTGKRKKLEGPNQYLSGVTLTLGQSLKIGKEPLKKPESGPDMRKPCINKRDGALLFCVEPVDWAASIKPYFEVNTIMYQGLQAIIRYDEGRASNLFTLFDSRAYKTIIDYYTKRFGPPTQRLQRGIAPLAQPRRSNPVSIWRSIDPATSLVTTMEIRQFDDSRVGFPDIRRGAIMLYHAWSEPIFPQLSALELMVLKPNEDSQAGAAPSAPGTPQASSKPAPNPFSSFP